MDSSPVKAQEVLDLVDISLLLHYGMFTSEPRLHGATLREVAYPGEKLTTARLKHGFAPTDGRLQTTMIFDAPPASEQTSAMTAKPDLPANMVPPESLLAYPQLNRLTPKQLETLFYQARAHDGCFTAVALLQKFFHSFQKSTTAAPRLLIRHGPAPDAAKGSPGRSYTTSMGTFRIVEQTFTKPRICTTTVIQPLGTGYVTGQDPTIIHAVAGFAPEGSPDLTSFLDLSSLQFGDVGRGLGGSGLFALDTMDEFDVRMSRIGGEVVDKDTKISHAIGPHPNEAWVTAVVARAKERWERRHVEKWCGHCGAPVSTEKMCAGCEAAWYCGRDHQRMAWGLHKHYCAKKTK